VIGNALEWYDFIVFGFFTVVIGDYSFPATTNTPHFYSPQPLSASAFSCGLWAEFCSASMPIAEVAKPHC
jgi:hypothetical protein